MRALVLRAVMALALTACYYAIALGIIGVLVGLPVYLAIATSKLPFIWLALLFYPIAIVIWRAAFPDRAERALPGLELPASEHPRLFAVIDEVAAACGTRSRPEVYLTLGSDAAVTELPAGFLRRSAPALILGLAWLETQTMAQLKSVLAHELRHYAGHDTRVGLWLHHTATRLNRTLVDLDIGGFGIHLPFYWYARLFERVTSAVQRRQELAGDEFAARLYGGDVGAAALRASHDAAVGFSGYWANELVPVLDAGFRPPAIDGFRRYMSTREVNKYLEEEWNQALAEEPDRNSTHPPLGDRIAIAAKFAGGGSRASTDRSALSLLSSPELLEPQVLALGSSDDRVASLEPVVWEEVGERVWVPVMESWVRPHRDSLRDLTIGSLPEAAEPRVAAAAACLTLRAQGWTLDVQPGTAMKVTRGAITLLPFRAAAEPASWRESCDRAGIGDESLATIPIAPGSPKKIAGNFNATLPLAADRKSKAPTVIGTVIVGAIAIPVALMAALAPLAVSAPPAAVVFGLVVGAATICLFAWFCLVHARQVFRPASVSLEGDTLTVDYPVLFKEPLRVARAAIRSVTVDPGGDGERKNQRFPLVAETWGYAGDPDAAVDWLWTKWGGSPVPMLSALQKRPNAVILFDPPASAPPLRREVAHGPLKGEALIGLLVAFADPQNAENAFAHLGIVRQLNVHDAEWIDGRYMGEATAAEDTAAAA